jgi:hypothetical protein
MMKKFERDDKNLVYLCQVSDIGKGKSRVFSISRGRGLKKISLYSISMKIIMQFLMFVHTWAAHLIKVV